MRPTIPLIVLAALGLAGCQSVRKEQVQISNAQPYSLSAAQVEKVKAGVNATLKDPYSSRFGNISASKTVLSDGLQGYVVCGEVNSKNSYGGYVGMTPFVGGFKLDGKEFKLLMLGGADGATGEVIAGCKMAGIIVGA